MDKWQGKTAIVTGASSGIGAAIVKEFAKNGINVVGLARRNEKVEEISGECKSLSGKIYAKKCDVSDLNSIKETFKWIEEKFTTVQILVNNAGIGANCRALNTTEERTNQMISTNFTGLVHCTREAVKLMNKSEDYGIIINISSVLDSVIPFSFASLYPATKHAVRAFSEIIRQELITNGNKKIRVTNLSPGLVETGIFEAAGVDKDDILSSMAHLQPEDIASAALYLLETPCNVNITQLTIKPVGEKM